MEGQTHKLNTKELTSFKLFDSFNFFFFSYISDNATSFLLSKNGDSKYSNIRGKIGHEACIAFPMIKKIMENTAGLLCARNLSHFIDAAEESLEMSDLEIELQYKDVRPDFHSSLCLEDLFKTVAHTPYRFQEEESSCAYFFIELPKLDLERVSQAVEKLGLPFQYKYFSAEEISECQDGEIDQHLIHLISRNNKLNAYINNYIINREIITEQETYIWLLCNPTMKNGRLFAIYSSFLKKHGERWRVYNVFQGEFPTEEELSQAKGVVIPGSVASVNNIERYPWIPRLCRLIRLIAGSYPQINMLGICFGGQIISQALGGKVENMGVGLVRKTEEYSIEEEFYELPFMRNLRVANPNKIRIVEVHEDQIVELPANAKLYARSSTANVEIFGIGENILGWQGHPDYNEKYQAARTFLSHRKTGEDDIDLYEQKWLSERSATPLTQKETLMICEAFLKKNNEN
jgi:GMP synthase-like glutamine amidotransferase